VSLFSLYVEYFYLLSLLDFLFLFFTSDYVETAVRHVMMKQGILGVKVSIMLPHDPKGIVGPKTLLSDVITILEPKDQRSY
jgi:ribosomal protein S3